MTWIFISIAAISIAIAAIVARVALWKDAQREIIKRKDGSLLEEEKKKLQKEYEEKERDLLSLTEQELRKTETERKKYEEKCRSLITRENYLEGSYKEKNEEAEAVLKRYKEAYQNAKSDVLRDLISPFRLDPVRQEQFFNEFCSDKGSRAVNEEMGFSKFNISCKIFSYKSGNTYDTSLNGCNCDDCKYKLNQNPDYICKHMLAFAIKINAFKIDPHSMTEQQSLLVRRERDFLRRAKNAEKEYEKIEKKIELLKEEEKSFEKWKDEVSVDFPWISETLVWIEEKYSDLLLQELPANAHKSEEIVKAIKKENKALAARVGELESRLATYGYFRLEKYKNMPLDELRAMAVEKENPRDSGGPDLEGKQ